MNRIILIAATAMVAVVAARAETLPKTMREAIIYCEQNSDARESGAADEHEISVEACAKRMMLAPETPDERAKCEENIKVVSLTAREAFVCKDNSLLGKVPNDILGNDACKSFANSDEGLAVAKEGMEVLDFMAARMGGIKKVCRMLHQAK